ncbi:MAG: nucleotidyltransferase domain-containing protein [Elusimicrobiota bacterium]|nr:nucleotidyltransferase domain-containing protein [Elusimicrobiota bacterium]
MKCDEILKIKNMILETVGADCEKIILFGSYAYGMPRADSDIDIYVVLKDGAKNPLLWLEDIGVGFSKHKYYEPVDLLANYKSRFEYRSAGGPTLERTVVNKGVVLYART